MGTYIEVNDTLGVSGGAVMGYVKNEDDDAIYDVQIHSPDFDATTTTLADGSYFISPVPSGEIQLTFTKVGYAEITDTLTITQDDTIIHNVVLPEIRGSLELTVLDSSDLSPIENATVAVTDDGSMNTNSSGIAHIDSVPAGNVEVTVTGPTDTDFTMQRFNITVPADSTVRDTVYMISGGRFTGTVYEDGTPLEGAVVTIDGCPDIADTSESNGSFTLPGVPAGIHTIKASKSGYITGKLENQSLSVGEVKSGLSITLTKSDFETICGFQVELDSVETLSNGNKKVTGYVVNIPSNLMIELKHSGQKLRFENVEVDTAGLPVDGELPFNESSVDTVSYTHLTLPTN